MNRFSVSVCTLLLLLVSASALAHYPIMSCERLDQQVECRVGFSDGSKAIGKRVRLINYDELELARKRADSHSKVSFKIPDGEFYIRFESGHEYPVELDYEEIH